MLRFLLATTLLLAGTGAPAALSGEAQAPVGPVSGHTVWPRGVPAPAVTVPKTARYVGGDRWTLYDAVDCEVHVFVEANHERRLKRIYWIQFEHYLPQAPDARYDYSGPLNRNMRIWGMPFRIRARYGPTSEVPKPDSDGAHVRNLIERAGYRFPADMMNVRLVHLIDDPADTGKGRAELMLLYVEHMAGVGKGHPTGSRSIEERWPTIEKRLVTRATERFHVEPPPATK